MPRSSCLHIRRCERCRGNTFEGNPGDLLLKSLTLSVLFVIWSRTFWAVFVYLLFLSSPPSQSRRWWSGPPLSVFDKLNLTLCISECQFVKYPKWGVTCRLLQPLLCRLSPLATQLLCLTGDVLHSHVKSGNRLNKDCQGRRVVYKTVWKIALSLRSSFSGLVLCFIDTSATSLPGFI